MQLSNCWPQKLYISLYNKLASYLADSKNTPFSDKFCKRVFASYATKTKFQSGHEVVWYN